MTYNVFGETLNLALSVSFTIQRGWIKLALQQGCAAHCQGHIAVFCYRTQTTHSGTQFLDFMHSS